MRIKIINPNTSWSVTRTIEKSAKKYARADTKIDTVSPENGPVVIKCKYHEALAMPGVLEEIKKGERDGYDGFIIAAFIDTALYAAREAAKVPVIGICEAAMLMSCMLGHKFSIIAVHDRLIPMLEEVVKRNGLTERCTSIRFVELVDEGVGELESIQDLEKARLVIAREGRKAIEEGAEVLILGGSVIAGLDVVLEKDLGIPIIDGVVAAVKFLEGLYDYGKKTSKILTFRQPDQKLMKGYPDILQP
jgi:allantoin racemase